MQKPLGIIETIAAEAENQIPGSIPLVRARTLTVTIRLTFGASIDADADINVYYSPDGKNWDTLVYATQAITFTAGGTIQKTFIIDPPEHGHIIVKVENGSDADTITNVFGWYSIQAWPDYPAQSRGLIETPEVYD